MLCFVDVLYRGTKLLKSQQVKKVKISSSLLNALFEHIWRKPQVTIFGQSAGSMSCSYHLYSPISRYLQVSETLYIIGLKFCLWQWCSTPPFYLLTIDFCNIIQKAQSFHNFQGFVSASNSSERRWWIRPLLPSSHCWAGSKVRSLATTLILSIVIRPM